MSSGDEGFLKRWSRLKRQAEDDTATAAPDAAADEAADEAPALPALDSLGPDSDFSAFMHPKVDPLLRRAALATLYRSPQYRAMDGLDVYIDDYSKPESLAPALAAGLRHARALLGGDDAARPEGAPMRSASSPLPADTEGADGEAPTQSVDAGVEAAGGDSIDGNDGAADRGDKA